MTEVRSHMTMLLTGDVMIGRGVDQLFDIHCDPQLFEAWVTDARHYVNLAEAKHGSIPRPVTHAYVWGDSLEDSAHEKPDIRIINLETCLTLSKAFAASKSIHYRAHPNQVGILRAAHIDGCVLADNHTMDWGREGLEETLKALKNVNIRCAGAGLNILDAEEAIPFSLPGITLKVVAWGSLTSGIPVTWQAGAKQSGVNIIECASLSHILQTLQALKAKDTLLLVSIHWGNNWGHDISCQQRSLAHTLVDQGRASIVHFHSSHHPKAIEVHRHRLILYGAGDLINDYEGIPGYEEYLPDLGMIYFPLIDGISGQLVTLRMRVYARRNMRLIRATEKEVMELSSLLQRPCLDLGTRLIHTGGNTLIIDTR
jgi:poly-gamma-glutamate capsule biosynthesis protein CapA/YwtB (metallophosphatase superfamily)